MNFKEGDKVRVIDVPEEQWDTAHVQLGEIYTIDKECDGGWNGAGYYLKEFKKVETLGRPWFYHYRFELAKGNEVKRDKHSIKVGDKLRILNGHDVFSTGSVVEVVKLHTSGKDFVGVTAKVLTGSGYVDRETGLYYTVIPDNDNPNNYSMNDWEFFEEEYVEDMKEQNDVTIKVGDSVKINTQGPESHWMIGFCVFPRMPLTENDVGYIHEVGTDGVIVAFRDGYVLHGKAESFIKEEKVMDKFEKGDLVEVVAECTRGPSIGTRLRVTKTPCVYEEGCELDVEGYEGFNAYEQSRFKLVKKAAPAPKVKYIHIRLDHTTSKGGGITVAFVEDEHYVTFGITSAAPNVPYNKKLGREAALKAFTESPQRLNLNTLRVAKDLNGKYNGRRADAVMLLQSMFAPIFL